MALSAADKELRYRNISIHSRGKDEHGTLHLLKHHACFSFYPKGSRESAHSRSASRNHQASTSDTDALKKPFGDDVTDSNLQPAAPQPTSSKSTAAPSEGLPKTAKPRPKDIWIPYPMIGYCLLRPSNAVSVGARAPNSDRSEPPVQDSDELFPPTFGTSSFNQRPSTDSTRLGTYSTPPRPSSPVRAYEPAAAYESARQPVIRIRRKDFGMMALHFNSGDSDMSADEIARQAFHVLRKRCCVDKIESLHAFEYHAHKDEVRASVAYDARREFARMGISPKAADGPGAAWRISEINKDYLYSHTYPSVLCVPKAVSDNLLKYGGTFRSKSRIPCLTYLHSNGGSVTRSSQPMVGVQNKRSPQDERLVSAIFSSHTPPLQSPEESPSEPPAFASASSAASDTLSEAPELAPAASSIPISQSDTALNEQANESRSAGPRVYGSTRKNLIADARPLKNVYANRVTGGGIEAVANYSGSNNMPVEKVFLNIANIHVMRKSLEKVIESFASADYVDMKPNQETLRRSGWLGHIAGLLDGSETVARTVGLGGSHVLVHCSDGWDRTAQVAALAQIMMDPHYRTLDGFVSLVQKDFLSFGHKFRDRDGIEGYDDWFKIENERIAPSRTRESSNSDPNSLNAMGQKAFTGAKQWFERSRGNFFNQPNTSGSNLSDQGSRSSSPPPNSLIHSSPTPTTREEDEHKRSEGEISPIFHQFLESVFQLLYQKRDAFEFNERFLKRLFYQVYACQYGEFLFNNEKDRSQHKLPSVWGHFLSRRQEFTNPEYIAKTDDPLIFPRRRGPAREVEVRWWADLFGRKDEEMNLPIALAPPPPTEPAPAQEPASLRPSMSFEDKTSTAEGDQSGTATPNGAIKETKSTPSFAAMRESLTNSFSSMTFRTPEAKRESAPEVVDTPSAPSEPIASSDASAQNDNVQAQHDDHHEASKEPTPITSKLDQMSMDEGDPLGVSSSAPTQVGGGGGLDFAAFASQNAFKDM